MKPKEIKNILTCVSQHMIMKYCRSCDLCDIYIYVCLSYIYVRYSLHHKKNYYNLVSLCNNI